MESCMSAYKYIDKYGSLCVIFFNTLNLVVLWLEGMLHGERCVVCYQGHPKPNKQFSARIVWQGAFP